MQKNILCYGDSNTWGFVPGSMDMQTFYMERYPREVRWTGIMQKTLGGDFYIIEEGMNGRTTNADSVTTPIPRNGKAYLPISLYTHAPLDLVILFLGMNDFKAEFNREPADVINGLKECIETIQQSTFGSDMRSPPKILLVGYPLPKHDHGFYGMFANATVRAKQVAHATPALAKQY